MRAVVALAVLAAALFVCGVVAHKGTNEDTWQDNEFTTNLWRIISSGNVQELKEIMETNSAVATTRAGDGRGPLWWAYEYGQDEMVELLLENGANPEERDADGKRPIEVKGNIGETEFAKQQQAAADAARALLDEQPLPAGGPADDDDDE